MNAPRDRLRALRPDVEEAVPVLMCLVLGGLLVALGVRDGGYFPSDHLLPAAIAAGCAAVALAAVRRWYPSRDALVVLGSLLGLAAWTGLSAGWSPDPAGADLEMERALGYAAIVLLALLAIGNGRRTALLLRVVVGALVVVSGIALLSRLRPEWVGTDPAILFASQGRLAHPVTYWNGLGAIAGMGLLGATGLAGDLREHVVVRAAASAGAVICGAVLYLTLSRGAGIATILAAALVLVGSARRGQYASALLISLAGATASVLLLRGNPIFVDAPSTLAEQQAEGGPILLGILLFAAAAAAAQSVAARVGDRIELWRARRRRLSAHSPRTLAVPAVTLVLVALMGYAVLGDALEGRAAGASGDLRSFVDRQYESFMNPIETSQAGEERLTSANTSRGKVYEVALGGFADNPLVGDGAAGFRVRWVAEREFAEDLRNAHSLPLETASDLGLVGLLLLGGVFVPLGLAFRGMRRRDGGLTRSQATTGTAIVAVWMVHSAIDWDWQLAAVTAPALVAGAALLSPRRRRRRGDPRRAAAPA